MSRSDLPALVARAKQHGMETILFTTGIYLDDAGALYQLGLEDTETARTLQQQGRTDESERMHREPQKVDMSSLGDVKFTKLRCSFTESYGITDDGDVYK